MTETEVPLRIVLVDPPAGVAFGIQRGHGSSYETLFVQQRTSGDLSFDFSVPAAGDGRTGAPNFRGPFAQGPVGGRFIYVDVGTYAGQKDTPWSRRMKIPLRGIAWPQVREATSKPGARLVARIPGRSRDGGPNCATVEFLDDWRVIVPRSR